MQPSDRPQCFTNHMGLWLCEPLWLRQAVQHIRSGVWQPEGAGPFFSPTMTWSGLLGAGGGRENSLADGIERSAGKTRIIAMHGPMMKGRSKFGGVSTVDVRRAIRAAAADDDVERILFHIDSPGGHVAGTHELAEDVRRVGKPTHAHIDDLGASAALWVASQADSISANTTAAVGSVGVIGVLEDSSEAFERAGVKVHVITTGTHKAAGLDGVPVTDEQLEHAQEMVEDTFGHFKRALKRGRGMNAEQMAAVSDGRVHIAEKARALGLIDRVQSFDAALANFGAPRRRRARAALDGLTLE